MEYRNFGSTGLKVSRLVVGGGEIGGVLDLEKTTELVQTAWDAGVSTFYTGDDYQMGNTERVLGEVIKSRRDDTVLMVKCGYRVGSYSTLAPQGEPKNAGEGYETQRLGRLDHNLLWKHGVVPTSRGMSRKHLFDALHASLRRLQTDYIDIYVPHYWDPQVPIEETMDTLNDFVRQGKVRYLGCSQHNSWQLMRALWTSDKHGYARYESTQLLMSLLERTTLQNDVPALNEVGVSMLASGFDAAGLLSEHDRELGFGYAEDNDARRKSPITQDALAKIGAVAKQSGRPLDELAAAWVLAQDSVVGLNVVPMRPEDMASQIAAIDAPLTADEQAALAEVTASLPLSLRAALSAA